MPRRVLCIEGDKGLRDRVKALLEREGFAVDLTGSGLDGITRALTLPPDLVLADVHLPDIEGAELAARLKQEKALAKVPFIAVGDSREEHDVALAAGADGFVERGRDDTLAEEVRAFLAGKRERLSEERRAHAAPGPLRRDGGAARDRGRGGAARHAPGRGARSPPERVHAQPRARALDPAHAARRLPPHPLLRASSVPLSPQQQRILDAMLQSVTRLTRVVDNLADFASLEVGEAPLIHGEVEPDRLAEDVVRELGAPIREARLHVTILPGGGGPSSPTRASSARRSRTSSGTR